MITTLSDTSVLSDLELFGRQLPLAPDVAKRKRPCIACNLQYIRAVDAEHHLCPHCVAEPEATRLMIHKLIEIADRHGNEATDDWAKCQALMSDETAERWTRLVQSRQLAQAKLERAKTGSYPSHMTPADIAAAIAAAERDAARIVTKIARTRAEPGNVLAALLENEDIYLAHIAELVRDKNRATLALQHLAIAAGDVPPF